MMRCDECRFWIGDCNNEEGCCHRYPPLVVLRPTQDILPEADTEDRFLASEHPLLDADNWCGEFQPRETEQQRQQIDEHKIRCDEREKCIQEIERSCGSDSWFHKDEAIRHIRGL